MARVRAAEVLKAGGLSVERKKYLYKEIRQYVFPDCQDDLRPSPSPTPPSPHQQQQASKNTGAVSENNCTIVQVVAAQQKYTSQCFLPHEELK